MKNILFSGLSSLLLPMGVYAGPTGIWKLNAVMLNPNWRFQKSR